MFNKVLCKRIFLKMLYKIFSLWPLNKNLIIMADSRFTVLPKNMKAIYDNIDLKKYKVKVFLKEENLNMLQKYFKFVKNIFYISVAKYIFLTDYYPLIYPLTPKKEVKIIQLWHACGAFKKFGYASMSSDWGHKKNFIKKYPIHNNYTHSIVSSEDMIKYYSLAFNMDMEKIFATGIPRTDIYFDEKFKNSAILNFKKKYNIIDKKIILYAPTYRGNNLYNTEYVMELNLELLREKLEGNYIILLKLHPLISNKFIIEDKYKKFVYDISNKINLEEAFIVSDMLISDYSSVIFEYSLLDKPIIMFPYDIEEYSQERGFFLDYKNYCFGSVAFNSNQLVDEICTIEEKFEISKLHEFKEYFMSSCDGNSTKKTINLIFKE